MDRWNNKNQYIPWQIWYAHGIMTQKEIETPDTISDGKPLEAVSTNIF